MAKSNTRLNQPPDASANGIESIPTPGVQIFKLLVNYNRRREKIGNIIQEEKILHIGPIEMGSGETVDVALTLTSREIVIQTQNNMGKLKKI